MLTKNAMKKAVPKKIAVVSVVLALTISLSACGPSDDASTASDDASKNQSATIEDAEPSISIEVAIPDYKDSEATPIPVAITGTDSGRQTVDETQYVDAEGKGLQLDEGEYTLAFPSSTLTKAGTFYIPPTNTYTLTVDPDLTDGYELDMKDGVASFEVCDPVNIQTEDLDRAYALALQSDYDADEAKRFLDITTALRSAAITEQEKAQAEADAKAKADAEEQARIEEEQRKAEEQRQAEEALAAKKAALHIETSLYSFDMPESWYDSVNVRIEGTTATVYSNYDPQESWRLIKFEVYPGSMPDSGGDIANALIDYIDLGNGTHIEVWRTNFAYLVHGRYTNEPGYFGPVLNDGQYAEILSILSGGAVSLADAQGPNYQEAWHTIDRYLVDNVVSTLRLNN